ncbi:2-dehydro-3-deoxyphosphogluconate aldolase/(4S)-4-hydroxy-2-oxoglutarate aldolase [Pontibacter ummariensis]|uniref:2-dehydro-3-deoxyphosphogluconate aldolase / (4S)-4-hydroxy-2-oxoglutarate aldolase n=1 Tax=Pontibacter ummariensis TaxID=1610492 RepID=A0A239H1B8_9BACT|nr:bifunctional 4-hydroxy-2-oxoglutarate aldolase/2-dehydro-3-deoxy-phosphogluconate aldolase [Pontibacter ummariensis]PRY10928.1 2-dehydro-3-deoxyphosphogluconate aldolase/(4S)-4-hydroxy-2-oxoglutarate aldolase [Pontibacter ummariensis]SNS75177.1 2-dehydro-3-deoxyphosphogluconate aldolase / (4S)-4-hydroxy-2-oxoglutarate aldolase [Pontibacter ummariensis]
MAKFSRIEVTLKMAETGMVPVFYHPDPEVCIQVLTACYNGGVRVFEFTNRGDFAHETFAQLLKHARTAFPELALGIGSIVDAPTAALYIQNGADFIVSPMLHEDVARTCNRRKVLWSPGCGSLTEISRAEELGAEVVKVFPALQVGGPEFVKAVKGPCPWSSLMPTGGVEPREENLKAWFDAGVHCVGMGSQLISKDIIAARNYGKLEEMTRNALGTIKRIRRK